MRTDLDDAGEDTVVDTHGRRRDEAPPLNIGAKVDRFVILSVIGEGGVGRVYAAYDPELDRQIALKWLKETRGSDDTEVARVRREAQALAKITHPNVVTVYDVGQHEGRLYLAMEYVSGQTLRGWVLSQRPPWRAVVDAFVSAGQGLLAVHEAGLVHRDVKPDNIMVSADGRVRVMDFGLARESFEPPIVTARGEGEGRGSTTLTRTGAIAGTPAYMAPEQHLGQPFDARTDQFALCVSLWEMLYGERPFPGENLASLTYNVTQGNRRPAPSDSAVPGWVRRAIERGLAVDPAMRYPSLAALLDALSHDPAARRRRALLAALSVTTIAALGWWAWASEPNPAPPACAEVETFNAVWDASRTPAELARAFERSGSPLAASATERVTQGLDAWAQQWNDARRDTCEATHVRREQSESLMDSRIACLDRRRARVAGIVEAFIAADAELVRKAPDIVASLEPLDECSDSERLRAVTPLPSDPQAAETIAELTLRLEALAARVDTGRTSFLLPEARELQAEADTTGYAPLRVDAMLLVAKIEETQAGPRQSLETTRAAYYLALQEGLSRQSAVAALEMMWRTSLSEPLSPTLPVWSEHARVLVRRVEPEGRLEAGRLVNEGVIEWQRGDLSRAVELTRSAIAIVERSLGARSVKAADYRNNLGYMTLMLGDEDEAKAHFEFSLAVWSETLGPDHPRLSVAHINLGGIALDQGRLVDARRWAERALQLNEEAGEGDGPNATSALRLIAELDRREGKLAHARDGFERVLASTTASVGANHWRTAQALAGLGELALLDGDLDTAAEQLGAAARIFEPLAASQRDYGRALVGLARVEAARGSWELARGHAERARERFIELGRRGERDLRELDEWLERSSDRGSALPE